jgi:phenylalanyl-tRNA synthetase beta chain
MTYSLVGAGASARLKLDGDATNGTAAQAQAEIPVHNAISADLSVLRTELLSSILGVARSTLRHRDRVAIFELARIYLPPMQPLPTEKLRLGIVMTGVAGLTAWNAPARQTDFFDLKGTITELLGRFNVPHRIAPARAGAYHPGRCAELFVGSGDGVSVGYLGQVHPLVAERFDLEGREVYAAELAFDTLVEHGLGQPQLEQLARFPGLDRDLALVLDRDAPNLDVVAAIRAVGGPLLERVALFDLYQGPQVAEGKRSLAYTLRFRAPDRTLTDAEADDAMSRIVAEVRQRFGAVIRGLDA